METVHKMLALLQEQNRTQKELTNYLGIKESVFSEWKSEKTKSYRKHINKIAEFFNVSINYFFDNQPTNIYLTPDETTALFTFRNLSPNGKSAFLQIAQNMVQAETAAELTPNQIKIKHGIFKASAGTGCSVWEQDAFEEILVDKTYYSTQADFCLTISGDSMLPVYQDGDIVLVKSQNDIEIGEIGIFIKGNQGYIKSKGFDRLISLNKNYPDIMQSEYDDIMCVGRVIGKL